MKTHLQTSIIHTTQHTDGESRVHSVTYALSLLCFWGWPAIITYTSFYLSVLQVFKYIKTSSTPCTETTLYNFEDHRNRSPTARCVSQQVVTLRISEPVAWHHVSCSAPPPKPSPLPVSLVLHLPAGDPDLLHLFFFPTKNHQNIKGHPCFVFFPPLTQSICASVASYIYFIEGQRSQSISFDILNRQSCSTEGQILLFVSLIVSSKLESSSVFFGGKSRSFQRKKRRSFVA